jgi:streptomycin 6-kinase
MGGHLPEAILHPTCEGAKLAMNTPLLERYLREWRLRLDGPLLESHSSWLQPARQLGRPVMLKLLKDTSDEQAGADVLRYFAGNGAVRLIAADPGGVLMERADDDVSLRMMALSGGDDRAAGILAGCVRRLHAPRECAAPDGLTP